MSNKKLSSKMVRVDSETWERLRDVTRRTGIPTIRLAAAAMDALANMPTAAVIATVAGFGEREMKRSKSVHD